MISYSNFTLKNRTLKLSPYLLKFAQQYSGWLEEVSDVGSKVPTVVSTDHRMNLVIHYWRHLAVETGKALLNLLR